MGEGWWLSVRFKARRTVVRGALLIATRGGSHVINSSSRSLVVGGARSIYRLARTRSVGVFIRASRDCADGAALETSEIRLLKNIMLMHNYNLTNTN